MLLYACMQLLLTEIKVLYLRGLNKNTGVRAAVAMRALVMSAKYIIEKPHHSSMSI